jgi:hypothetical protein
MKEEVIAELIEQAEDIVAGSRKDEGMELIKLVIMKCMDICENLKFSDEGPSSAAKYQRVLCSHAIQKHFGL